MKHDKVLEPIDLNGVYKEIADVFGVEVAVEFHKHFKGVQITYPIRFLSKSYVLRQLEEEYTGENLRELSLKYGYSERWFRILIKKCKEEQDGDE